MEQQGRLKFAPKLYREIKAALRWPGFISEFHYFKKAHPEVIRVSSAVIGHSRCRLVPSSDVLCHIFISGTFATVRV